MLAGVMMITFIVSFSILLVIVGVVEILLSFKKRRWGENR